MNDKPLPINHGYPVRIIAPGIAGARSVKWLDRITVQDSESKNFYQQRDYKILPPEATNRKEAEKYWARTAAIQDMPVNSVIGIPESDSKVTLDAAGTVLVRGYALPKGDQGPVVQVEVSADGGKTWVPAQLQADRSKWCWVLWQARLRMPRGPAGRILSRATDAGGNVQEAHPQWNLRGVGYNGYGESRNLHIV